MKNPGTLSIWVRGAGLLLTMIAGLLACSAVWAENIDPEDADAQYAWGENIGWLNAEPSDLSEPGLTVTSTAVTGYAWAENIGWISFSCENTNSCTDENFGVQNDGGGNLSGYAWGENIGWISFSCHNTSSCAAVDYGVAIEAITGQFSGYAWGENIGWIAFDSVSLFDFGIVTAWGSSNCLGDIEPDGDVDGVDLADYAMNNGAGSLDLRSFAAEFGTLCGQ